jgi:hypothetical protein
MEKDQPRRPLLEVEEISETVRIYSTAYVQDEWADDIISGILRHPYVESVRPLFDGSVLSFRVGVSDPEHWDKYIDPHCREIIQSAIDFHL